MAQLVLTYSVGDGCTFSCDCTLPFEYESAEAAYLDFEILFKAARDDTGVVTFAGEEFFCHQLTWDGGKG